MHWEGLEELQLNISQGTPVEIHLCLSDPLPRMYQPWGLNPFYLSVSDQGGHDAELRHEEQLEPHDDRGHAAVGSHLQQVVEDCRIGQGQIVVEVAAVWRI